MVNATASVRGGLVHLRRKIAGKEEENERKSESSLSKKRTSRNLTKLSPEHRADFDLLLYKVWKETPKERFFSLCRRFSGA